MHWHIHIFTSAQKQTISISIKGDYDYFYLKVHCVVLGKTFFIRCKRSLPNDDFS